MKAVFITVLKIFALAREGKRKRKGRKKKEKGKKKEREKTEKR